MRKLWAAAFVLCSPITAYAMPDIDTFTEDMVEQSGYVPFFYDKSQDRVYIEIDKLDTQMLFQTSLPQGMGSNDIGLDRGQLGDTRIVSFTRHGNKVLLKQVNTTYQASSNNKAEHNSITEAFAQSVIAGFEVVAEDGDDVLVDYTSYLLSDVHGISQRLQQKQQGSFQPDASRSAVYLPRSKAFEDNTELESVVTFAGNNPGQFVEQVTPDPTSISVHLHHSFVKLPDDNYEPREYHPFAGYWKAGYFDYSTAISEPLEQKFITRHRLYKKDPEAKHSEPVKPIVYYLDPGIPEPVMSALKEGASWWSQAFTDIGYDNAFQVKVLPEDADPMDVRYNVIQWVHRATRGWSYGSSVTDPRTGEIIKGHVTLGSLRVRQDYLIAQGLTSPFTGDADTKAQQEMALDRIRQLAAHEVGHTLGIAHNFAASENGRESVMDYPHPKVTLKNGKIVLDDAYDKGMGKWDLHAIAYGYQDYSSPEAEKAGLAAEIDNARAQNLSFKTDFDTRSSSTASANGHMWDNGQDPLAAYDEITAIRERALASMGVSSIPEHASLSSLEDVLVPVYLLHRYQLVAVAKQVGGLEYSYERKGDYDTPHGQSAVPAAQQKRAMKQLLNATSAEFLRMPDTLLKLITPTNYGDDVTREQFKGKMGLAMDPVSAAASAANYAFSLLLDTTRLNRLSWQAANDRALPGVGALVSRIMEQHWYKQSESDYGLQRRLRLVALNALFTALDDPQLAPEAKMDIQSALMNFTRWLDKKSDLQEAPVLHQQMKQYWQTGQWPGQFTVNPLPPGSPI
nr:zinc-dependent metalloprotease [Salinimonas lutimaris]